MATRAMAFIAAIIGISATATMLGSAAANIAVITWRACGTAPADAPVAAWRTRYTINAATIPDETPVVITLAAATPVGI